MLVTPSRCCKAYIPAETLLVIGVDLASFLELCDQLVDGLLVLLGVKVHDESVNHGDGCENLILVRRIGMKLICCV